VGKVKVSVAWIGPKQRLPARITSFNLLHMLAAILQYLLSSVLQNGVRMRKTFCVAVFRKKMFAVTMRQQLLGLVQEES
jgi:hypothetical protein